MIEVQRELADLKRTLAALVALLARPLTWEGFARTFTAADQLERVTGPAVVGALQVASGAQVELYDLENPPGAIASLQPTARRLVVGAGSGFSGPPIRCRRGVVLRSLAGAVDVAGAFRALTPGEAAEEPGP